MKCNHLSISLDRRRRHRKGKGAYHRYRCVVFGCKLKTGWHDTEFEAFVEMEGLIRKT